MSPYTSNDTVAYTYDTLGRVASRTVDSSVQSFTYDKLDRRIAETSALGSFSMTYLGQTGQITDRHNFVGMVTGPAGTQWSYGTNNEDRRLRLISNSMQYPSGALSWPPE